MANKIKFAASTLSALIALNVGVAAAQTTDNPANSWYLQGQAELQANLQQSSIRARAKNIILFVGDGMGISTVTAARILEGQKRGESGEENSLSFERMPYAALAKTYNTNQQTPDSAGTMTAMMTGVKTRAGVINIDETALRGDCASSQGHELTTLLEQMEMQGRATGIVSTARITHATPAATFAHVPERGWEDNDDLPEDAVNLGCKDIARQLIEFPYGDGIDVALGGGRRHFIGQDMADPEDEGKTGNRSDGRDLTEEWLQQDNSDYVWNLEEFNNVDTENTEHLLGLFERSHMEYEVDRASDTGGEPSLLEMTDTALNILDNNPQGYFLMVESGRIDHGHHAGNANRALNDTIAMSDAIAHAMAITDPSETLIVVTADHSHVFTIGGYPTRGNPILGKVIGNDYQGEAKNSVTTAKDGMPYTTLAYANGRGFADLDIGGDTRYGEPIAAGSRVDLTHTDTEHQGFHQEAMVPLSSETHSGEDVAIYAQGPWAHLFRRTHEQNYIYHVMNFAANEANNPWSGMMANYQAGDTVDYNGRQYRVIQAHTSQANWTPEMVPALFVEI